MHDAIETSPLFLKVDMFVVHWIDFINRYWRKDQAYLVGLEAIQMKPLVDAGSVCFF